MDYRVKTIIGGTTLLETADIVEKQEDGVSYQEPSISDIKLLDNATIGTMEIGATPSDCLTFTINSPNRQNYDGETVELWIAPPGDDSANMEEMTGLENEVGNDASDEGIDDGEQTDELDEGDDSQGEVPTAEELADVEETAAENIESLYTAFEGEAETVVDEDTDEAEEPEWVRIGTFYVQSQTNADDGSAVTLTCYDAMQKLNRRFFPSDSTATVQDMFDDLRTQTLDNLEVVIDEFDYDEDASRSITMPSPVTYREVLGWFAGLMGGYATCDDDGSIGFALYSYSDGLYLDSTLNYLNVDASGEMELDGIECDTGFLQENIISAGFEADLKFKNPLMTQDVLEDILEAYKGIRFSGGAMNMTWDSSINAGTFIRIMTPDEYTNYLQLQNALEAGGTDEEILAIKENMNALGRVLLVSYQLIDFTGDATTTIASCCSSVTQSENQMTSPTDAKFNRVTAKIIETEQLIAQKADIEDLEAAQADIQHLKVGDLTIGGVTVNIYDLALAIKQSSVATETTWYKAADTVPAAPTVRDPSSLGWSTIEPVYDMNRENHLYSCMCVTYADDSLADPHFVWGDVHLIQSWEAAKDAYVHADQADEAASEAASSASTAYNSASLAINQLGVVEDIVGVLEIVSSNGNYQRTSDLEPVPNKWYFLKASDDPPEYQVQTNVSFEYVLTTDASIVPEKPYYTRSGAGTEQDPYSYNQVETPVASELSTYYENTNWNYYVLVGIDHAIENYVSSHLVLSGNSLLLQNGNTRVELSTTEGMILYNESGSPIARYGEEAVIGDLSKFHIVATTNYNNTGQGRLSFYKDSVYEVAYISGDSLYITQSVVLNQMDIGRSASEIDPATGQNGKGKWSWKVHAINNKNNLYLKWLG